MTEHFDQSWLCLGRVEDLPAPGSWLRAPLTRAGVLVTRGDDHRLRAFHAVCTHRGSALFDLSAPEHGSKATRFTCPYHNFEFELDGRACAQVPDLAPVRIDTAHGFVFVNLDNHAPPLAEALGETPPWFDRADLAHARLKRAHRVAYDIAARWAIVVENFQESLHFASVHPALEALTPSALAETWMPSTGATGPWLGGIMPIAPHAETVSTSGRRNGRPFLVPEEDRRVVHDAMRFPNLLTSLQPDYLLTFTLFPLGPARTRVVASTYVHQDAPDDADAIEDVTAFWARVHDEDRIACERHERGMSSHPVVAQYTDVEEGAAAVAKLVAPDQLVRTPGGGAGAGAKLAGIFGKPYADLSELIDISSFDELHREITRGLALAPTSYTGGTLKWMGVCAPWVPREPHRDAMDAIRAMSKEELAELVALGDGDDDNDAASDATARDLDPKDPDLAFGDETDRPFTKAQMLFLEQRHGVYFPWKACYHLLENDRWDDKHSGDGKSFSDEARALFPKTVAFVESLPFVEIGRVVIFGLHPNDHAPAHRDSEPGKALAIAQSISFEPSRSAAGAAGDPRRHKRFYLSAPDGSSETAVDAPIYWFNDMDWHGVHADPWFRYSVRVDGVFEPSFLDRIRRKMRRP